MDELAARAGGDSGIVFALKADGRAGFCVHTSSTQGACHVRGIDFHAVFQAEQALEDAVIEGIGSLFSWNGKIRTGHVADEEGVASQYQPGIIAAAGVGDGQGDVLRAMAGSMDDAQSGDTETQFISIFKILMWIGDICKFMHIDFGTSAAGNLAMAGNMV